MKFSQPVKLGVVTGSDASLIMDKIEGGTSIADGVIKFGSGDDAIYFHQQESSPKYLYGGRNLQNTFPFLSAYGCDFTQIKADKNLTLYMIHEWQFDIFGETYVLLGRLSDGSFVKYFDSRDLRKNFFDQVSNRNYAPYFSGWRLDGDTVVLEYKRYSGNGGEFRFKWDDAAQWFSVEQIIY